MTSPSVVEGLFGIHKPTDISSAQVIREVQKHFNPSELFRPWLEEETARLQQARSHHDKARFRRGRRKLEVKIGHGGTLDPMATGVLILGVGSGTKRLSEFLSCTKSYDAVLLFGQTTDTYDVLGRTVARKPFDQITREKVETALDNFRGSIMQRPPIYSALRVQGKRLYEYAREGKEVPIEIQPRPVTVEKLELVEWYEGGKHSYHWPQADASAEEKKIAETVLHLEGQASSTTEKPILKRSRSSEEGEQSAKRAKGEPEPDAAAVPSPQEHSASQEAAPASPQEPCPAPACLLRMTVTSGFYVRSLCHDLGEAVDSYGTMASLVRTRQGEFELGKNVFEYDELAKGEETWGPQIKEMLTPKSA